MYIKAIDFCKKKYFNFNLLFDDNGLLNRRRAFGKYWMIQTDTAYMRIRICKHGRGEWSFFALTGKNITCYCFSCVLYNIDNIRQDEGNVRVRRPRVIDQKIMDLTI